MNLTLLISRIIFTVIIIGAAYFALVKVWTQKVDILALLKKPSQGIPIAEETQLNATKVSIHPNELIVQPLYQEFTVHVTNHNIFQFMITQL